MYKTAALSAGNRTASYTHRPPSPTDSPEAFHSDKVLDLEAR